jgi:hypothetical protein
VLCLRAAHEANPVKFAVLNDVSTSADTMAHLKSNFPDLAADPSLELVQSKVCVCADSNKRNHRKLVVEARSLLVSVKKN